MQMCINCEKIQSKIRKKYCPLHKSPTLMSLVEVVLRGEKKSYEGDAKNCDENRISKKTKNKIGRKVTYVFIYSTSD